MTGTAGDTEMTTGNDNHNGSFIEYVTVMIGGQLFGLPISKVQDVFMLDRLARVPLASAEIAGVLNLRGRIVTAIDMHCRLGLGQRQMDRAAMAVGIEYRSESYGLLIDSVGEVLKLAESGREPNPVNLDPHLAPGSMLLIEPAKIPEPLTAQEPARAQATEGIRVGFLPLWAMAVFPKILKMHRLVEAPRRALNKATHALLPNLPGPVAASFPHPMPFSDSTTRTADIGAMMLLIATGDTFRVEHM